jgi:hydrogenase large subunit
MPVITASIDPVTRIEGHLKVDVKVDTVNGVQQVVDVHTIGTLFRGFERILHNRDPRDAPIITSRICGVCPTSHAMAAALTLDHACGVTAPDAGRILRNLVHGACYLESHILHFYLLSLPDYIKGPSMAPWLPGWDPGLRLDSGTESAFLGHYLAAIEIRRKAHEMGAIYAGKLPHSPAFIAGGFTAISTAEQKTQFGAYLNELLAFIEGAYIPDAERLASLYPEYFAIGRGYGNLLSFGVYELNAGGTSKLLSAGRIVNGVAGVQSLDPSAISEHIVHSWYQPSTNDAHPSVGETIPQYPKLDAYSWLKSPRYGGLPYECGPLARMAVNGDYPHGVSVMDRHRARAWEARKLALAMKSWLDELPVGVSGYTHPILPDVGASAGLTEAPRGALGHWLSIESQ